MTRLGGAYFKTSTVTTFWAASADPDDIVCMDFEGFSAKYLQHIRALLNRVEGTVSLSDEYKPLYKLI